MELESFDEILSDYFNEKFGQKEDSFWDREVGTYHASDFGKCLRKIYYEHELGKADSLKKRLEKFDSNNLEIFLTIKEAGEVHELRKIPEDFPSCKLNLAECAELNKEKEKKKDIQKIRDKLIELLDEENPKPGELSSYFDEEQLKSAKSILIRWNRDGKIYFDEKNRWRLNK